MVARHHRRGVRRMSLVLSSCATILSGVAIFSHAAPPEAFDSNDTGIPVERATSDMQGPFRRYGVSTSVAWNRPAALGRQLLRATPLYDNGVQLDDFGQPLSQLSLAIDDTGRPEFFPFNAAAADDFVLDDFVSPQTDFQITMIRAAFIFTDQGSSSADPMTTWTQGIDVTVYANSALTMPAGNPVGDGTFSNFVQTQSVPAASLTATRVDTGCFPLFVVDIPVDFMLGKNTRYWLSLVPRFAGPPFCFWCLSDENHDFSAHQGADFGPAFWNPILGNESSFLCTNTPPAMTKTDLAFQVFGQEAPASMIACCDTATGLCRDIIAPATCLGSEVSHPGATCQFVGCTATVGACCDDSLATCTDGVNIALCQGVNQRFTPNVLCMDLNPPCGTTALGACCFVDQSCSQLNPTDCSQQGGQWNAGTCAGVTCPSANDDCTSGVLISSGTIQFDTRGASTDGPADSPGGSCTDVNQDIWFRYIATCDGQMIVSLCLGTDYDAALAVYEGCACGPSLGPQLACDNDFCAFGGAAALATAVRAGTCYLIRVGGAGNAVGRGTLSVVCVPDLTCCRGDTNGDGLLDLTDMSGLIAALLNPPQSATAAFCQADVNADGAVNGLDIQPLVDLLTAAAVCPTPITGACCFADLSCVEDTVDGCFFSGGIYQGDDTICIPNLCSPPVISCCLGDLNSDAFLDVSDVTLMIAALLNPPAFGTVTFCAADVNEDGVVNGLDIQPLIDRVIGGVSCIPPITGACCLSNGTCLQDTLDGCTMAGGIYQGDNTVCSANLCPQPLRIECCPGDFNSDGTVDTLDVSGFVAATLNPPAVETPDFCRADINLDSSVDSGDIDGFVMLVLNQTPCPLPSNDICSNARNLSCNSRLVVDNSLATTGVADPAFSCHFGGPAQGAGTLWFSFVATDGTALVSTCDSFSPVNDTILAVYDTACPVAGNEIACSEDAGGACGRLSELCVSGLTPGQTYYIQVASFNAVTQGFVALKIVCPCP